MGAIGVGICDKEAARARDAALKAEQKLAQTVKDLERSLPQPGGAKGMGWEWATQCYEGGWEGFSFPVIGIGHGIGWANTVVLWNASNRRSVIVQADLSQLCDPNSSVRRQVQTPLCEATNKSLTDIALEVGRSS